MSNIQLASYTGRSYQSSNNTSTPEYVRGCRDVGGMTVANNSSRNQPLEEAVSLALLQLPAFINKNVSVAGQVASISGESMVKAHGCIRQSNLELAPALGCGTITINGLNVLDTMASPSAIFSKADELREQALVDLAFVPTSREKIKIAARIRKLSPENVVAVAARTVTATVVQALGASGTKRLIAEIKAQPDQAQKTVGNLLTACRS